MLWRLLGTFPGTFLGPRVLRRGRGLEASPLRTTYQAGRKGFFLRNSAALTRRAKHWQNGIIERSLVGPRGAICGGLFHSPKQALTRRAKHRQNDIIDTSWFTRAESFRRGFFRLDFEIGRRRRITATHSSNLERRSARRRPYHCWPCTRERAGPRRWVICSRRCGPRTRG